MAAGDEISVASISNKKLENVAQKAEVAVFKKALDQQGDVVKTVIEGATKPTVLPAGVGAKVNTVA